MLALAAPSLPIISFAAVERIPVKSMYTEVLTTVPRYSTQLLYVAASENPEPADKPVLPVSFVVPDNVVAPTTVPPSVKFRGLSIMLLKSLFCVFKNEIFFCKILFIFYEIIRIQL